VAAAGAVAGTVATALLRATGWPGDQPLADAVQALAFGTVLTLALSAPVAGIAVVTAGWRLFVAYAWQPGRWGLLRDITLKPDDVLPAGTGTGGKLGQRSWAANSQLPPGREVGATGICVSGGGIRSATFSLGALQKLQRAGELGKSRYLVGVSGGGYAAGAMRLAFGRYPAAGMVQPTNVFADGSPEFHHVRNNSRYLADGPREWLAALGVVLRGLLVVQLILLTTSMLLGLAVGRAYALVPVLSQLLRDPARGSNGLWYAIGGTFTVAVVVWIVGVTGENMREGARPRRRLLRLKRAAGPLAWVGLLMLVVVVALPALVWLSSQVNHRYHGWSLSPGNRLASAATTGAGVLSTAYLASLAGIFLRVRRTASSLLRYLPARVAHLLLVYLAVLVLVITHVYVFARIVFDSATAHARPGDNWRGLLPQYWFWVAALIFLVLAVLIDQTRWSLHPFYKERLMTAFAVKRSPTGATAYAFDAEHTDLDAYCSRVPGFPQVILLASANVKGSTTPPGRHALPYSLSGDWIGGPRLGWVTPRAAQQVVGPPIRDDLTLQAAMAISGAAFASAMGASSKPYSVLFAMTNARLGTWLPNPAFLYHYREPVAHRWYLPRPPGWRRLQHLIREVFAMYPSDGRLLLATDGGHYDNLGLIELLRHFPRVAYCFDASGGSSLEAGALGAAIALAHEELGARIVFDTPTTDVEPGLPDATPDGILPPSRLARSCVLTGTIHYPESRPERAPASGRLYLGKAVLTADTPWEVLAYARQHAQFPNDPTSDQWFDHEQFDAYHALGQYVAGRVLAASIADEWSTLPARLDEMKGALV
ncbi:MAG TPA: hypothetical protein VJT31_30125, partial [Rugosimonospora sp.]|nr:hypothetical protein [Rugosimonospora sp.]